ncbi:nucleoside deaminase [Pleionea litopenaei]|uniref:Nucleoside deaminase n=1 Tax=Pleionea litopenaei TaxID=3070815 RepID=A0AA51RSK3_9GAMM|nr:nucleoside deaminase [Pleionea sp. HL-JVS1]WMS86898.1 nucleoside deaminase [Pleionea sp. HL-JVS1]
MSIKQPSSKQRSSKQHFLELAVELATLHSAGGRCGPFGAVVVYQDQVVGQGWNQVVSCCDPTAHAEVMAIRDACKTLERHELSGCEIYASCQPCPMCLSAIVWARLDRVFYAATKDAAAKAGFDDARLYAAFTEQQLPTLIASEYLALESAEKVLADWRKNPNKVDY